ncbi:MAG: PQQ-binding-like beta-propeller repeat protein, partial [Blastocatellia bacterium]
MLNSEALSRCGFSLIALAMIIVTQTVSAQDWTQWRGPNRDGVARDFVPPAQWPEKLNLIWKTEVGSGFSSPVVSKDRAWIHTRKGEEEFVSCLDLK